MNAAVTDRALNRKRRIGRNVRLARETAPGGLLTQTQIAHALGATQVQVSKWETGQHRPSDEYLERIALITGRTFGWFFDPHDDEDGAGPQ